VAACAYGVLFNKASRGNIRGAHEDGMGCKSFCRLRWGCALLCWQVLAVAGAGAATGAVQCVLILESFGRDVAPFSGVPPVFKTELAQQSPVRIEFHEAALETPRLGEPQAEAIFADYLRALYARHKPDLVVPIGAPASQFWLRHRAVLFPAVPMLIGGIDQRLLPTLALTSNDTAVATQLDLPAGVEIVWQLFPDTTNLTVVMGNSPFEKLWIAQCRQAWQPYTGRMQFTFLNELPFPEMCRRVGTLPPRSAIGYGLLLVDAAGVPQERMDNLERLCAAANAPVFGMYEGQLGHGIIGGWLISGAAQGREAAKAAVRVLRGELAGSLSIPVVHAVPMFDWRQLQHWRVDERRLPPGSVVRFRQPSVWDRYRWWIIGALAIIVFQAATIAGLLLQRVGRHRAEQSAREVGGRLITAQEEERRRIARDLHDDLNQRLALLSVELDLAGHLPGALTSRLEEMAAQVKDLSSEVHRLSYQLHPAKLDQLGLVTAARTLCSELSSPSGVRIKFTHEHIPRDLPAEVGLCLYRVTQEALGNAIRHSGAADVQAHLCRTDGRVGLTVADTGQGFDPARARRDGGLGLLSMEERARLVHGQFSIRSEPGRGTRVELWVPLPDAGPGDAS